MTETAKNEKDLRPSIDAYFKKETLEMEGERIFGKSLQYAGHSLLTPQKNDYFVLPHHQSGLALIHNENGIQLMSNICRHRQAPLLSGRGNTKFITCPLHRWTYDTKGSLLVAPKFTTHPRLDLKVLPTGVWNGMHFLGEEYGLGQLKEIPSKIRTIIDFDAYYFSHCEIHDCDYNWKTFIEFYLEDYHVSSYHPGLGNFVSCEELEWHFNDCWSVQTVGFHENLERPGNSETYKAWHQATREYFKEGLPDFGAIWILIYPNTMIEWYPLVMIISTILPQNETRSSNVVEYYHNTDLKFLKDGESMVSTAARAYLETAEEDNELGELMQCGRNALRWRKVSEAGPYHDRLEAGMAAFHRYWSEKMSLI